MFLNNWEERFYTPSPPPGSDFRDCKCARIETTASIHHPPLGGGGGGGGGSGGSGHIPPP